MVKNITQVEFKNIEKLEFKKVAAYARVSSGKDTMLKSLYAQVSYYSSYIQGNKEWTYVGVYADEAITGTKDNRPEFQRMIRDCEDGEIDLIITKSISRFARNTVTVLETVRKLKAINVEVFFEQENIWSKSCDGELMLSILSSFAQEESKSVSDNCKWRIRDKMKKGKLHSLTIYGFKLVDGTLQVKEEEAKIVREIFSDFLSGMGTQAITNKLIENKVPTVLGGEWSKTVIRRMLSNEKYVGDLLLQKTYIDDHISKKSCVNTGQLPMYFAENSHEAIIDKEIFAQVQEEKARRTHKGHARRTYDFTSKITCGICDKHYKRKISNGGTKYEKPVWICNTFNTKGKKHCASGQIPEKILLDIIPANFKTITVKDRGVLEVLLQDDSTNIITWKNPSRADSWTDEMRNAARAKRSVIK